MGEKGLIEQALEERRIQFPGRGPIAVVIESFAPAYLNPGIEQHVARTAIETGYRLVRVQQRQVAEAPDVQYRARRAGIGKQCFVKRWHQGGTLSVSSDIATTEVTYHRDARKFGQQGGVADLDRESPGGFVANRLAVAADGADLPRLEVVLTEQRCNALGGQRCPLLLRQRGAGQFVVSGAAQGQQLLAKAEGIGI